MSDRIWELPGPSSFIRDIVQDIKNGVNVVIHIPKFNFFNFDQYLRNTLNEELNWYELKPTLIEKSPLNFLVESFFTEKNSLINSLQELVDKIDTMKFMWLDFNSLSKEDKEKWILFLKEYIRICDQKDRFSRLVFCFNVSDNLIKEEFNSAFIREHFFYDYTSELDFERAINEMISSENYDYINRKVIQSTIFELSYPNFDFAFYLIDRVDDLSRLNIGLFREYVESRKISFDSKFLRRINLFGKPKFINRSHPIYYYWLNNLISIKNERIEISAINHICRGEKDSELIKQIIWHAQMKTLFPLLEQYRIRLIEYIKRTGKVKELISANVLSEINEIYELELGSLFHFVVVERIILLPQIINKLLITIRDIRNDISHLRILPQNKIDKLRNTISDFDKEFSTIYN